MLTIFFLERISTTSPATFGSFSLRMAVRFYFQLDATSTETYGNYTSVSDNGGGSRWIPLKWFAREYVI